MNCTQLLLDKLVKSWAGQLSKLGLVFYCLSYLISPIAHAEGVVAGIDIENIAVVSYEIDGNAQSPIESTPEGNSLPGLGNGSVTSFKVDRKVDLLLTGDNNANVTPGDTQSEVTFTLLNEGNDTQKFLLSNDENITGDNFDSDNCNTTITHTVDDSNIVSPLTPVITNNNITLAPDHKATISIKCDIPENYSGQPLVTGNTSQISLTAVALENTDGSSVSQTVGSDTQDSLDTVFADNAGTDDGNRDATHSARRSFVAIDSAIPPTLTINKSIDNVIDPEGGSTAVSGAKVTYKIVVNTTGTGVINNVVVTDPTPTDMTYQSNTIFLESQNLTDSVGDDSAFFNTSNKVATINLGSINAGSQHEITLTYIIN